MAVEITGVEANSPAAAAGVRPGELLLRIGGHEIEDVLDYRFYMTEADPLLTLRTPDGAERTLRVNKPEYAELGLEFATYLMDKQRSCRNRCVFCFIDQLPPGLRESLYFKDDDARMSFLFGNYITLTNLRERDVERILEMHISPVNVSVHTTNPVLRAEMMGNRHAGKALEILPRLAGAGIRLNAQLVLCPGLNDGAELERSLEDLCALAPGLQSVAVVPVGLTRYRRGLAPLRGFSRNEAGAVLETVARWGDRMLERHGARICYAADEFYLLAGQPMPEESFYGEFDQLENGVGLWALLRGEFLDALDYLDPPAHPVPRRITLATGMAALPLIRELAAAACKRYPWLAIGVVGIQNRFFGESITVAGLVTGADLLDQLAGQALGQELLLPAVMLRHERDLFLDSLPVHQLSQRLGIPVTPVENSGEALLRAMLGGDRPE